MVALRWERLYTTDHWVWLVGIAWSFCLTHTIEQIHGSFLRQLVTVLLDDEFHHVVAGLAVVREFRTFI